MATKRKSANSNTRMQRSLKLDELELTGSSSRNMLISNVKQMFEKGTIRTISAAEGLIKLIQENKMDEFGKKLPRKKKPKTQEKQRTSFKKSFWQHKQEQLQKKHVNWYNVKPF